MASNLLKTFEKIDSHRMQLINKANEYGAKLKNSASFAELLPFIEAQEYPVYDKYNLNENESWSRPEGWPDCREILRNAEVKDGLYPGIIMLLDANSDTTLLRKYVTGTSSGSYMSNKSGAGNVCASGYLLSDGTWYNDTTNEITHTWDKTKDIVVNEGRLPGTYRWVILYYSSSKAIDYINLTYLPMVELIVGNVKHTSTTWNSGLLVSMGEDSPCSDYLRHVEILEESNFSGFTWSYGMYPKLFGGMRLLEEITVSKTLSSSTSTYATSGFTGLSRLKELNFSKLGFSGGTYTCTKADSLERLILSGNMVFYISENLPSLKLVEGANSKIRFNNSNVQIPKDCVFHIKGFECANLPAYWSTNKDIPIVAYTNTSSPFSNNPFIEALDLSNVTDFYYSSNVLNHPTPSSRSNAYTVLCSNCFRLKNIEWPSEVVNRFDLTRVYLDKECIIQLFENLISVTDLSGLTYMDVLIHEKNYNELTEDEIKIATDKGWGVKKWL